MNRLGLRPWQWIALGVATLGVVVLSVSLGVLSQQAIEPSSRLTAQEPSSRMGTSSNAGVRPTYIAAPVAPPVAVPSPTAEPPLVDLELAPPGGDPPTVVEAPPALTVPQEVQCPTGQVSVSFGPLNSTPTRTYSGEIDSFDYEVSGRVTNQATSPMRFYLAPSLTGYDLRGQATALIHGQWSNTPPVGYVTVLPGDSLGFTGRGILHSEAYGIVQWYSVGEPESAMWDDARPYSCLSPAGADVVIRPDPLPR